MGNGAVEARDVSDPTPTRPTRSITDRLRELGGIVPPIVALLAVYMVIDRLVLRLTDLEAAGYGEPLLVLELVRQRWIIVVPLVVVAAAAAWMTKSVGPPWPKLERGWSLAVPVGVAIATLTWAFSFYEYNLYFDRGHMFDRVLLMAFAILAVWRPIFVIPWLALLAMIVQQFYYPIGGYSVTEAWQLGRIIELATALLLIRLVAKRWYAVEFVFLAIALVASAYWVSGLGKVRLGWLTAGPHLDDLLFATYGNGWLGFLSVDSITDVGRAMGPFLWPMLIGGAIVELGAIMVFWHRRLLIGWLVLFIVFHVNVFALTGIFFWKWMAFEAVLLAFLLRDRLIDVLPIFTLPYALVGTILIVLGPVWSRPVELSWLDSPVSYGYEFQATDVNGDTSELPPWFFRPYDYQFTLQNFAYLYDDAQLPIVWGATDDQTVAEAVYGAETVDDVLRIEAELGTNRFEPTQTEALEFFLRQFVGHWNERRSHSSGFSILHAPPHLWTFTDDGFDEQSAIATVTIWQFMTFWDGDEFFEVRRSMLREIDIPV